MRHWYSMHAYVFNHTHCLQEHLSAITVARCSMMKSLELRTLIGLYDMILKDYDMITNRNDLLNLFTTYVWVNRHNVPLTDLQE